jgi:hypothetical protein
MTKLIPFSVVLLALIGHAAAQQTDLSNKPSASVGNNRPKPGKESNTRTIEGTVKDASDNPLRDSIVQLKDTKTSKVVAIVTKDDGKFAFNDLAMDINYELLAKHGDTATPVKKVSLYDSRKIVVVNFQMAADKLHQ